MKIFGILLVLMAAVSLYAQKQTATIGLPSFWEEKKTLASRVFLWKAKAS